MAEADFTKAQDYLRRAEEAEAWQEAAIPRKCAKAALLAAFRVTTQRRVS